MKNSILFLTVFIGLLNMELTAGEGGQSGLFLRRGVGSRSLALGNAYTSLADDASAIYWNPAGLSNINKREFLGMFSILSFNRQEYFASLANHFEKFGTVGIGWLHYGVSEVEESNTPSGTTKKFSDGENAIYLSYGRAFEFISIGVSGKYFYHILSDYTASGFGMDIGVKAILSQGVSLGVAVQDIASSLTWTTTSNFNKSIPTVIRFGGAYATPFAPTVLIFEGRKVSNEGILFRGGLEYALAEDFGLRGGYDGNDITFGGYIKLETDAVVSRIDYATNDDLFESLFVHYFTLRISFK